MRPVRDLIATARFLFLPIVLFLTAAAPGAAAVKSAAAKKVPGAPSSISKIAPASALAALSEGQAVDVIVEFADASVRQMAAEMRAAKGLAVDSQEILEMKAARYAPLKLMAMDVVSDGDIETIREYSHLPMSLLRVRSRAALDRLLASGGRGRVRRRAPAQQLSESRVLVGQPAAAAAGYRGAGTTVAVLDGGVEYGRAAFGSCTSPGVPGRCLVVAYQDFADPDNRLDDPDLHGTNVCEPCSGSLPRAASPRWTSSTTTRPTPPSCSPRSLESDQQGDLQHRRDESLPGGDTFDAPCATGPYTTPFSPTSRAAHRPGRRVGQRR